MEELKCCLKAISPTSLSAETWERATKAYQWARACLASAVSPTALCPPCVAAPSLPARLSCRSRGRWAAAMPRCWGFVWSMQAGEQAQRQLCRGRQAAEGAKQRGGSIALVTRTGVLHPLLALHLCRHSQRGTGTRHSNSLPPAHSPGEVRDGRRVLGLQESIPHRAGSDGGCRRDQGLDKRLGRRPRRWILSPTYSGQSLAIDSRAMRACQS